MLTAIASNLSNLADTFTVVGVAFGAGIVLLVLRCWRQAVGISRVYLGLHHPSDIIAGAVLGVAALVAAVGAARTLEVEGLEVEGS